MSDLITVNGVIPLVDGKALLSRGIPAGIEVLEDSRHYPTKIRIYGNNVWQSAFGYISRYDGASKITDVTLMGNAVAVQSYAFAFTNIANINMENIVSVDNASFRECSALTVANLLNCGGGFNNYTFQNCTHLTTINAPKLSSLYSLNSGSGCIRGCTALTTATFGSVGHKITSTTQYDFYGCTQAGLTLTFYTDGSKADTILANCRAGATNAKIIIKASEDTTYNGETYLAGETIVTSEVA